MDDEIVAALAKAPFQIELYSEDMEATLFPDDAVQQQFRKWYIHKYRDRKPDVVVAVGLEPLKFMVEAHEQYFPGIPVIFCGTTKEMLGQLRLGADFTGVWAVAQPEKTLQAALGLQPDTQQVVVVGGVGEYDQHLEAIAKESFRKYESRLQFTYLTDLDMPTLVERLKHLPDHTIVYHTSIMQDASGTRFIDATQAVPIVADAASAPVFVVDDVDLNRGTVGGYLLSFEEVGRSVGEMAVRILKGEKPQDIPIEASPNVYMFDWRALQRWGLKESNLPPGSLVLNRQPTVWELFRWYILGGTALILLEALLISALIWQRSTRKKVETELAIAYDRLRLAMASGKSVAWDLDVKTGRDRWFGDLQTMFGIQSNTYEGDVADFYDRVHPEDRQRVSEAVAVARKTQHPYLAEFRVVHDDGSVRWATANGQFYPAHNGTPERMLGIAVDITERLQAETAIRESEERFRLVANTAPVMIWMSGTDKLCNYFNKPWLDFTGRALEQELGNGWSEGVHSEDFTQCLKTYTEAFDERESFEMEYRLRRNDGEYRWILDIGVPRFGTDGSFAGYIGSCLDVTERRRAEEALAGIGRRLIEAHEEERTWIGRELHDDINQRLALLSVEVDRLSHEHRSDRSLSESFRRVHQHIVDIGRDVQALSHRLHSSKLEYLGLMTAAKSFCRELSDSAKVEVQFSHSALPPTIPKEVSLCLFRVLQEALQNAVKYSGVKTFRVNLYGTPNSIELTVFDNGKGFEEQEAFSRQGLGLISMRERLQMVNGVLDIRTHFGAGTTISARVPLPTADSRAMAG
ncbi:MAG TPA: ABC transporter substrate binding protein [Terriglobales bacterium]|nr:ABC transporter substrate binding protein [Terriglobales bacterium]